MKKRTIANSIIIISALFFPWHITFVLACVFGFLFPFYVEAMVLGALVDAIYSPGNHYGVYAGGIMFALSSIIPFIISRTPWHSR